MGSKLSEFTEESDVENAFVISTTSETLVIATQNFEDMHGWMNALLKQKLYIEQAMNSVDF